MKCDDKDVLTKGMAQRRARQDSKRTKELIVAYPCVRHGGWHVGHPTLLRGSTRKDRV